MEDRTAPSATPSIGTTVRVNDPAVNVQYPSAISADGRYALFTGVTDPTNPANIKADVLLKDLTTGATTLVSADANGVPGNYHSAGGTVSADGRFVAFTSGAGNWVAGAFPGRAQAFVKNLQTGALTLVSVGANGPADASCENATISADGRFVAFISSATNLVDGVAVGAGHVQVYVKDLQTGAVRIASTAGSGVGADSPNAWGSPALSADGRYVAFVSQAGNLVVGDAPGRPDVFVKDMSTGAIALASSSATGSPGNDYSYVASISADGQRVAFASEATNLIPGDANGQGDVFVKDLRTGAVTLVSAGAAGPGNGYSFGGSISGDGRYVSFVSEADNLVAGDANGQADVFVKDLLTGAVALASGGIHGPADGSAWVPDNAVPNAISADGRYVLFTSGATDVVAGDTNGAPDAFLADMLVNLREGGAIRLTGTAGSIWDVSKNGVAGFAAGTGPSFTFTPDDQGTYVVTLTATDGSASMSRTLAVGNVAPTATLANTGPAAEGSAVTVAFGSPADAPADLAAGLRYSFATSPTALAASYAAATDGASKGYAFADSGSYVVYGRVFDKDEGYRDYQTTVSVGNVAPTIALTGPSSVDVGVTYTLTLGSVVDPGPDIVTAYTIFWGDGTSSAFAGSPNGLGKTHFYSTAAPGGTAMAITVGLTDEDGTYAAAGSKTVTVTGTSLLAWGYNYGQLGDGTLTNRTTASAVSRLTNVIAVVGGDNHYLALKSDGTVWAWGQNGHGQLGDGTTTNRSAPVQVPGLTGVTALAAGAYHTLALKSDGTVRAWGENSYGQLGDGTTLTRYSPVQVLGVTDAAAVDAARYSSVARRALRPGWVGSGQAVNGYLVGATAFFDADFNGHLDAGEPSTTTGAAGAFSLVVPLTFDDNGNGTIDDAEGQWVVTGGTDASTRLPAASTLTAPATWTAVTPLTTLASVLAAGHGLSMDEATTRVLDALGLPAVDLATLDPIAGTLSGDAAAAAVFAAHAQVQDTVAQAVAVLAGAGATPSRENLVGSLLSGIADRIAAPGSTLDLGDAAAVAPLLLGAAADAGVTIAPDVAAGAAAVIAAGNALIASIPLTGDLAYLQQVSQVKAVAQGAAAADLAAAAAGTTAIAGIVADNTGTALVTQVAAAATPPTVIAPTAVVAEATGASGAAVEFAVTATDLAGGSVPVVCTPASGSLFPVGVTVVTYTATDAAGRVTTGTFTVTVLPSQVRPTVSNPPSAVAQTFTFDEDTELTAAVSATDVDGDTLTYSMVSGPSHGTLGFDAAGTFRYTPAADYNGTDTFTFTADDGTQISNTATVTITVRAVNDAAVITGTSTVSLTETNAAQSTGGTLAATDVDGSAAFAARTGAAGGNGYGTFGITAAGVWTYAMNTAHDEFVAGQTYTDSITVATADGTTQVITVTMTGTNDAPILSVGPLTFTETGITFTASATDTDLPASALTYSLVGAPAGATIDPLTGVFNWTPGADQLGAYSVAVVVSDGHTSVTQNVAVTTLGVVNGDLIYVGSIHTDNVGFAPASGDRVSVTRNGIALGSFSGVNRIVAYGLGGDDDIQVAGSLSQSAWLYGGAGDDRLKGGGGNDVLLGGSGNDLLVGGAGRDLLIGGTGADRIVGNSDDDILVAGSTAYDLGSLGNQSALSSIMSIWGSSESYFDRVATLTGGWLKSEGDNAAEVKVFDDGAEDVLTGSAGQDWFLAKMDTIGYAGTTFKKDKVTDLGASEFAADLDFINGI